MWCHSKKKNINSTGTRRNAKTSADQESERETCINNLGMWGAVNPRTQSSGVGGGGESALRLPLGCLDSLSIFPLENLFQADCICLSLSVVMNGSRKFPVYPTLVSPQFPEWEQERGTRWKACPFLRTQRTLGPLPPLNSFTWWGCIAPFSSLRFHSPINTDTTLC